MATQTEAIVPKSSAGARKGLVFLAILVALVVAGTQLPVKDWFVAALGWIDGLGAAGPVVVAVLYVVACVLFLPGSILTLGAGFLFGVPLGVATVSIGSTLGACAAFLVGRFMAREAVASRISANAKFAAIDDAVGREGFKIVFLTRLTPLLPFNLLNYAFGLTKVRFGAYALASWIGMIPGTIMYVYLGGAAGSLAQVAAGNREKTAGEQVLFFVGLAVTVLVATLVTRVAKKALDEAVEKDAEILQTTP